MNWAGLMIGAALVVAGILTLSSGIGVVLLAVVAWVALRR